MGILTHRFVSFVADGPYPTQVNPSNWNEPHSFTGGTNGALLVRSTSAASSSEGIAWLSQTSVVNNILLGQGSSATPVWGTVAFPTTTTIGDIVYATASSVFGTLAASSTFGAELVSSSSAGPSWWAARARLTSQQDVTTATLANTALSVALSSARSYDFEAMLYTTSSSGAGVKFAMSGTATATAIIYEAVVIDGTTISAHTRAQASSTAVGGITTVTAAYARITGTITVNAAGTLLVQFAQNTSTVNASSLLVGSMLRVNPVA